MADARSAHVPWTLVLLGIASAFFFAQIKMPYNLYDESVVVFGAARVAGGDVPYRDFWSIYPPGQFYAVALLFDWFGTTLLNARIYDVAIRLLIVLGVLGLCRKSTSPGLAALAACGAILLLGTVGGFLYSVFPAIAFSLLALLCVLEYVETARRRSLVLAGVLLGAALLFRWDIGAYAAAAVLSALWLGRSSRVPLRASVPLVTLVAAAIAGLAYACVGLRAGFDNLIDQVFVFPLASHYDVRGLPLPRVVPQVFVPTDIVSIKALHTEWLRWLQFYFPLAVYGVAGVHYGRRLLRERRAAPGAAGLGDPTLARRVPAVVFGGLLFSHALSRFDFVHVVPTSLMAFVVMGGLGHDLAEACPAAFRRAGWVAAGLCLFYFQAPLRYLAHTLVDYPPLGCYSHLERAACVGVAADQEEAVELIRSRVPEGESIFVGNRSHERIFTNDVGFYFLADRPSATRYHELLPGVATTRAVQEAIEREVSARAMWVVLVDFPESGEANASSVASDVHVLDEFLRSRYARVGEFGRYEIRHRIDGVGGP